MNNILIVGGAGYIGSHVAKEFYEKGYNCTVFDNLSTGHRKNVIDGISFIKGDLQDYDSIKEALTGKDCVVHLAALKSAGDSMKEPQSFSKQNIAGTINLINACIEVGVSKFVFSSSAAVYGDPVYMPMDEDHRKEPVNYYGHTKLAIEDMLSWYDKLMGLKFVNLRYFNAVGYDVDGKITEPERNVSNLMPIVMETLLGERDSMSIFGSDYNTRDGTCIRDYVHVNDLAAAHVSSYEYLIENNESNSFNLGSSKGISVKEMIDEVERISMKKINYSIADRRPGDPGTILASSEKAFKILGWSPKYSDVGTIIRTMLSIYSK